MHLRACLHDASRQLHNLNTTSEGLDIVVAEVGKDQRLHDLREQNHYWPEA
jgi:hypothetical protein